MKLSFDGKKTVLYLNKFYIIDVDFKNKESIQNYVRDLLLKIADIYNIEFNGYYNINLFVDNNYGVIIEMIKDELEYFDYFGNITDFNIKVIYGSFLYEVTYIEDEMRKFFTIYNLNDRFYLKALDNFNYDLGRIMEMCDSVIYGYNVREILKKAVIV